MPINNPTSLSREEFLRKKRKKKIIKYTTIFSLVVFLIGLVSYLSHRREVRISSVVLKGGVLVTEAEISNRTNAYLNSSYFWLFPKNVSFWYPRTKLENYLKNSFQRIDSINIHLDGLRTLVVEIEERKPFAIWCNSVFENINISTSTESGDSNTQKCYFIDQNSTIFSEAPYFSGDAYFKYYGKVSTTSPIGSYYIASTTEFEQIYNFINFVRKMSVHPVYLVANPSGDYSLTVSGGGEIYFDMKKPLSETAKNLESLLKTPALSTSTNDDLPIEYIDLRYGNKLFYKLKGE